MDLYFGGGIGGFVNFVLHFNWLWGSNRRVQLFFGFFFFGIRFGKSFGDIVIEFLVEGDGLGFLDVGTI